MASIMDSLLNRGKPAAVKGLLSPVEQDKPIGMGLLGDMTNPIAKAMMAYGFTGQGNDPAGAMLGAYIGETDRMSAQKAAAEARAKQQAIFDQIQQGLSNGKASPAMAAQYAAMGGEGAGTIMDAVKHVSTPQSYTPGSMMYNTATGAMSMPAPKMGEGQMWDGGQVTSAPGYLQAYGAQKAVDAQNAIDQYAGQQGIGYQYDLGRIKEQTAADIGKYGAQQSIGYGYDVGKMGVADQIAKGQEAFKAGIGAEGDVMTVTNPDGSQSYVSRADVLRQGGQAGRSPERAAYKAERAKANATTYQASLSAAEKAGTQLANIDRIAGLFAEVGDGTGKGEQALMGLNSLANQVGFNFDPTQGAKESIVSITNQMALGMREPGSGSTSDKDMDVFLATVPSIAGTPDGNAKIMDTMAVFAQRKQKEAELMQRYAAGNGGVFDDEGEAALNKWRKNNPIKW